MKSRTISIVMAGAVCAVLICAINVASAFAMDNHAVAELRPNDDAFIEHHKPQVSDVTSASEVDRDTLLQDWESGIGDWGVDNGVWEVGVPTYGPDSAHSDSMCAGTNLDGDYPNGTNTRLISPEITLHSLRPGERIRLRFWHWFSTENNFDVGYVQISTDGGVSWVTISEPYEGQSVVWTRACADLSAYADSTVHIAFYLIATNGTGGYPGWYIDDVWIEVGPDSFPNPEDFKLGLGDWCVDNGVWEVGVPTYGPDSAHSDSMCAGTNLDGDYPNGINTRLISPEITLTPEEPGASIRLYFWHWFYSEDNFDVGYVQISVNGSTWETIGGPFSGYSEDWTPPLAINLSSYADSTVRIAFYFIAGNTTGGYPGWYVDDVRIEGIEGCVNEAVQGTHVTNMFVLCQNQPNPFKPITQINYTLPRDCNVKIEVFNSLGQKVAVLVDKKHSAGYKSVRWDASIFSAGVYFYRLQAEDFADVKKMVIMK